MLLRNQRQLFIIRVGANVCGILLTILVLTAQQITPIPTSSPTAVVIESVVPQPEFIFTPVVSTAVAPTELQLTPEITVVPAGFNPDAIDITEESSPMGLPPAIQSASTDETETTDNIPLILAAVGMLTAIGSIGIALLVGKRRKVSPSIPPTQPAVPPARPLEELMGDQRPRNVIPSYTPPQRSSELDHGE